MPPSTVDRLKDISETIDKIDCATHGMTRQSFAADEIVRAATERYLGIVCEAALRLPLELKEQGNDIEWRQTNDFANVLRHGYHAVNVDQVWKIVQQDVPKLRAFSDGALRARDRD